MESLIVLVNTVSQSDILFPPGPGERACNLTTSNQGLRAQDPKNSLGRKRCFL